MSPAVENTYKEKESKLFSKELLELYRNVEEVKKTQEENPLLSYYYISSIFEETKQYKRPFYDPENYTIGVAKSLRNYSTNKIIMEAIKRLEYKIEENSKQLAEFRGEIANLLTKTGFLEERGEGIIIYFKDRNQCHKAFSYLIDREVGFQPIGGGVIMASQKVAEILEKGDFRFETTKNTKELYEKEPNLINNYVEQVKKHYKLPSWTNH